MSALPSAVSRRNTRAQYSPFDNSYQKQDQQYRRDAIFPRTCTEGKVEAVKKAWIFVAKAT
jgi:hypothetical protein